MPKIYVSPSDQVKNAYAAGNTTEAIQCRKIATALVKALERCGFESKTNLTASMQERVAESNAWGADAHTCIHSNAFDKKVSGTRIFSFDLKGEGYKIAVAVFNRLAPITPGTSENVKAYPALYEVRASNAPCVYIEVDFHDVDSVALWIIDNTEEIAEAICQGICDHFGVTYKAATPATPAKPDRYNKVSEMPVWARAEMQALIDSGALKGDEKGNLDLSEDMMRCLIISKRYTETLK